jgi:hypothetical protein
MEWGRRGLMSHPGDEVPSGLSKHLQVQNLAFLLKNLPPLQGHDCVSAYGILGLQVGTHGYRKQ